MDMVNFSTSALSLVPPAIAIILAITTRRVLLSLGSGILVGSFMLQNGNIGNTVKYIADIVKGLVWEDGAPNSWNLYIILFLIILGVMTTLISIAGGSRAFGEWALTKVKSKRGAQILTAFLGLFIFIDDYFNSLAVGNISRPLTDRQNISRAKLAYLIDSTAAPICVISPISSWGAYIITLIGSVMAAHKVTEYTEISAFLYMVPMNFYAMFAILMVFVVAYFGFDFGPMLTHERLADQGQIYDNSKGVPPGASSDLPESPNGKVLDLILPIVVLILATTAAMIYTGYQSLVGDGKPFGILGAFENTDVGASLVYGGITGLAVALVILLSKKLPFSHVITGFTKGTKSMLPAIYILFFAWTIIKVINNMETGKYLASMIDGSIDTAYIPALLFILSGIMAFATGTSWGTFGIMLPIAGDISAATDITMLLPVLAAVLAGSVFGDHCSPISDTTILSSTGAGSHHIDHVVTQLPYTCTVAVTSIVGYLVLGETGSVAMGMVAGLATFSVLLIIAKKFFCESPQENKVASKIA